MKHSTDAPSETFRSSTFGFQEIFFSDSPHRRYAFGINEYSTHLAAQSRLDGFIDDYTDRKTYLDKPVLKLASVPPDGFVVSCVTCNRPITALHRIQQAGIQHYCDYFSLADASGGRLPQVSAIAETRCDHRVHGDRYASLRQRLSDEESRHVLDRIMEFRLAGSLQAMADFQYRAEHQYFEPFVILKKGEVFVDGGGYDGFTALQFVDRCPEYSAIHFFEPSKETLALARARLVGLPRIHYHPVGLYDKATTLSFDASAGSASRIVENGCDRIGVARPALLRCQQDDVI